MEAAATVMTTVTGTATTTATTQKTPTGCRCSASSIRRGVFGMFVSACVNQVHKDDVDFRLFVVATLWDAHECVTS